MSRESYLAGLEDGATSTSREVPRDESYDGDEDYARGYVLGRQDVLSRLALYDRERWPSQAVRDLYPDAQYVSEREADG